jgi:hypothetical protein
VNQEQWQQKRDWIQKQYQHWVSGAVTDYLEPILEPLFHASSFGYRLGRSTRDALAQ